MKKEIKVSLVVSLMLGGMSYLSSMDSENLGISDIVESNIEALAGSEDGTVTIPCVRKENEDCTYTVKLVSGETQERTEHGLDEAKN